MRRAALRLPRPASERLTESFRLGDQVQSFGDLAEAIDPPFEVEVDALGDVLRAVMADPAIAGSDGEPERTDAFLAVAIHCLLRVSRRQAADRGLWFWLAAEQFPDYVRWRFPGGATGTAPNRFDGPLRDNAISRLWMAAELGRNGSDYGPVRALFAKQDIVNTWLSLNAAHNRVVPLAAGRVLQSASRYGINPLAKKLNHVLSTVSLDALAPGPSPDHVALSEWRSETPQSAEDLLSGEPAQGPAEEPVSDDVIRAMEEELLEIADRCNVSLGEFAPEALEPGHVYTRRWLRLRFGIEDATINNGVFAIDAANVLLFVTERKTTDRTQYVDRLDGDRLEWQGQTKRRTDPLIIGHSEGGTALHLFYRSEKYEHAGAGFRYEGTFRYETHSTPDEGPSSFTLVRDPGGEAGC